MPVSLTKVPADGIDRNSCGCPTDYHMSDCPIRTGGYDLYDEFNSAWYDHDNPRDMDLYDGD